METTSITSSTREKHQKAQEVIDNLKRRVKRLKATMSSEDESSEINSEEYKEIEREIEKCAKVIEELDKRRTLKEQRDKLISMRREIERRLKKEENKSKGKIEMFAEKIKEMEERKNKLIKRSKRDVTTKHQDEVRNSDGESIGEAKAKIEIDEEIKRRKKVYITYEIDGDKIRRKVRYTDRSNSRQARPATIGKKITKKQEKKYHRKVNRPNKKDDKATKGELSTSKQADILDRTPRSPENTNGDSMWREIEQPDQTESTIEDSEEEAEIGETRPKPIKRRRLEDTDSENMKKRKVQRKKKTKVIYDLKRSEIAKKNYVNLYAKDTTKDTGKPK